MATIGPHFRWSADPAHRKTIARFFTEVLDAQASTPVPNIDSFTLNPQSSVGVVYGKPEDALAEADQPKATWVEFLVDDVDASTKKLAAMGMKPIEYHDKQHSYFRVPGGPVFRLAKLSLLVMAVMLAACGTGGGGGGTSGGGGTAGGGTAGGAPPSCPPPEDAGPPVYLALVRGTLALPDGGSPGDAGYTAADLAAMRDRHNAIAMGGEAQARAAGDFAHDVLLGTTLLSQAGGTKADEFVALDRWSDATAMQGFYANPQIAAAFGTLFSGPPSIELFEARPTWVNWGDMQSGDSHTPYWFHFALGTQSGSEDSARQLAHDQVACGGKAPSLGAGNLAHVVYTGLTDRSRFLAVDIWGSSTNIEAFYTNPDFVAAFGQLFSSVGQPTYVSTNGPATPTGRTGWYQW